MQFKGDCEKMPEKLFEGFEGLVKEISYQHGEQIVDWCIAEFKGKEKLIDIHLRKNGCLVLTNLRIIFKEGAVIGAWF
jgi:hypothetical protein